MYAFGYGFFSLIIMFLISIHVVMCEGSSLLFIAVENSIIWIYHRLFILFSHWDIWVILGLTILKKAAMNICVQVLLWRCFHISKYLEVGFLGYMVSECLTLQKPSKLFPQSDIPLNILTNIVSEFHLLQILGNTWCGQSFIISHTNRL